MDKTRAAPDCAFQGRLQVSEPTHPFWPSFFLQNFADALSWNSEVMKHNGEFEIKKKVYGGPAGYFFF